MCPGGLVRHPVDFCIRQEVANEVEFGGAGLRVVAGNGPYGATVKVDSVVVWVRRLAASSRVGELRWRRFRGCGPVFQPLRRHCVLVR